MRVCGNETLVPGWLRLDAGWVLIDGAPLGLPLLLAHASPHRMNRLPCEDQVREKPTERPSERLAERPADRHPQAVSSPGDSDAEDDALSPSELCTLEASVSRVTPPFPTWSIHVSHDVTLFDRFIHTALVFLLFSNLTTRTPSSLLSAAARASSSGASRVRSGPSSARTATVQCSSRWMLRAPSSGWSPARLARAVCALMTPRPRSRKEKDARHHSSRSCSRASWRLNGVSSRRPFSSRAATMRHSGSPASIAGGDYATPRTGKDSPRERTRGVGSLRSAARQAVLSLGFPAGRAHCV